MQKYADVVLDLKGNVVPDAEVRVKTSAGVDAVLYADADATPAANPIITDSFGRFSFYAVNGRYNLQVYKGNALLATSTDILLEDPMDETPEVIKNGIITDSALSNITIDGKAPAYKDDTDALDERVTIIEEATGASGRWCGAFAEAPTTRLNGDPLQEGDEYQNTVTNLRYTWSGGSWFALNSITKNFPFAYVAGQAQYDVGVISSDASITTAGMVLWVEGVIEYDFTVDDAYKFTLGAGMIAALADGAQMRLIVNANFDDVVSNLAELDAALTEAEAQREIEFQQFLVNSGLEVAVPYTPGLVLTRATQVVTYMGDDYRVQANFLPLTTTNWVNDAPKMQLVDTLREELAAPTGSGLLGHQLDVAGAQPRTGAGKLNEHSSIKDFGPAGTGNGVTSDHLAAVAMGAAMGFIHFSRGNYVLDTCALDYPVSFDKKANVTANAGQTVTIRAPITSPKQYILKGAGTYVLTQNDAAAGEDVREVHVSWFGAFPNLGDLSDQGPAFRKLFTAVGNRESIAHCDIGGYVIDSTVPITRAGWLKGAGSRRTVFKCTSDGFPLFVDTSGGLAKITDCNFEIPSGSTTRNSPFIEFSYNEFELNNIRLGQSKKGIVTTGNAGRISNITAAYGANQGVGSDLIQIKGGSGIDIEKIQLLTSSSFGPESVVRVGGVGHLGVGNVNIRNIQHITPSISVSVEAFDLNIAGVIVDGVQYSGFAGTAPAQIIKLETSGAGSLDNVNIGKVQGSTRSIAVVSCLQNSSSFMRRIVIDGVQDRRTDSNGIELIRTNGILEDVDIGSGVQLKTRTNPVYRSGTLGSVRVAAGVEKDSSPMLGKVANIPDDTVYVCALGKSVFVAGVKLFCATGATFNWGDYIVRAASAPAAFPINQSAAMDTALTALTGTTGTDGKITLGITDGVLYVENRSGATINIAMSVTGA